jgi:hypothetical protein
MLLCAQVPVPLHVSIVHRLLSALHAVPDGASGCATHVPVAGLHAVPPSHGGVGGWHVTVLTCAHVPLPLQASLVHRFPSALHAVPDGASGCATHVPVAGLHAVPPSHGGTAGWQLTAPDWKHAPVPLQVSIVH